MTIIEGGGREAVNVAETLLARATAAEAEVGRLRNAAQINQNAAILLQRTESALSAERAQRERVEEAARDLLEKCRDLPLGNASVKRLAPFAAAEAKLRAALAREGSSDDR